MQNIKLRPAASGDAAAILEIYAPVVRETSASFEIEPPSITDMQSRMLTILADYPWLVAEADSRILGYAYASRHRPRPAYQWVVETSVYVHPQARHKGLATRMYKALLAILQLQGFYKAYAVITLPGLSSIGLHESLGFTHFAVYKAVGYKLNTWHDVGWWERVLRPAASEPQVPTPFSALVGSQQIADILEGESAA
ncbi:MAG TPA: N-acetyltransferase family protein [Anaerolineales bacterium]|nr:N-acetyltransferase family protein [Anaerolineales bacterium]HRQ91339.1 N-acetyltransferase family protein [Anaerolineales bacterium]